MVRALQWLLIAGCLGACSGNSGGDDTDTDTDTDTDVNEVGVEVVSCDDPSLVLSSEVKAALMSSGMTQCAMPFGILLAADAELGTPYVELSAKILAELLDPDQDGQPNDPAVAQALSDWRRGWLAMPVNPGRWESSQLPQLQRVLGYDIIIPAWWMETTHLPTPDSHARAVMVEEVTHFITQFGWGPTYPAQFGVEDWSSVIARETQRAACEWWQHPENDCPGSPAPIPDAECEDANCDVVEFYHQVLILRAGMEPAWRGIGFPATAEQLENLLSAEIKAVMDDPQYHQPRQPLSYRYPSLNE